MESSLIQLKSSRINWVCVGYKSSWELMLFVVMYNMPTLNKIYLLTYLLCQFGVQVHVVLDRDIPQIRLLKWALVQLKQGWFYEILELIPFIHRFNSVRMHLSEFSPSLSFTHYIFYGPISRFVSFVVRHELFKDGRRLERGVCCQLF